MDDAGAPQGSASEEVETDMELKPTLVSEQPRSEAHDEQLPPQLQLQLQPILPPSSSLSSSVSSSEVLKVAPSISNASDDANVQLPSESTATYTTTKEPAHAQDVKPNANGDADAHINAESVVEGEPAGDTASTQETAAKSVNKQPQDSKASATSAVSDSAKAAENVDVPSSSLHSFAKDQPATKASRQYNPRQYYDQQQAYHPMPRRGEYDSQQSGYQQQAPQLHLSGPQSMHPPPARPSSAPGFDPAFAAAAMAPPPYGYEQAYISYAYQDFARGSVTPPPPGALPAPQGAYYPQYYVYTADPRQVNSPGQVNAMMFTDSLAAGLYPGQRAGIPPFMYDGGYAAAMSGYYPGQVAYGEPQVGGSYPMQPGPMPPGFHNPYTQPPNVMHGIPIAGPGVPQAQMGWAPRYEDRARKSSGGRSANVGNMEYGTARGGPIRRTPGSMTDLKKTNSAGSRYSSKEKDLSVQANAAPTGVGQGGDANASNSTGAAVAAPTAAPQYRHGRHSGHSQTASQVSQTSPALKPDMNAAIAVASAMGSSIQPSTGLHHRHPAVNESGAHGNRRNDVVSMGNTSMLLSLTDTGIPVDSKLSSEGGEDTRIMHNPHSNMANSTLSRSALLQPTSTSATGTAIAPGGNVYKSKYELVSGASAEHAENVHLEHLSDMVKEATNAPNRAEALADLLSGWLDQVRYCIELREKFRRKMLQESSPPTRSLILKDNDNGYDSNNAIVSENQSEGPLQGDNSRVSSSAPRGDKYPPKNEITVEDDDAATVPMDIALRQSDALELAIDVAIFEIAAMEGGIPDRLQQVLLELCSLYMYGSSNLHRAIFASYQSLSQDANIALQERSVIKTVTSMLKHACKESGAFRTDLKLLSSDRAESDPSSLAKSASLSSTSSINDYQSFRSVCSIAQASTLRLAVFRGFREQLLHFVPKEVHSSSENGAAVHISDVLHCTVQSVEDELYDTIAVAEQDLANVWDQMVGVCEDLLTTLYERVHGRVSSLEADIQATENLSDLREVLRRVTQLCKAHEAVVRYTVEISAEANQILLAFFTLFQLIATIFSSMNTSLVSHVIQAARRLSRLCNEVPDSLSIRGFIDVLKETAANNPSALMGMGNKTARALRFEANSQRTAEMRARRHARMKSSPDELLNLQPRLSETMDGQSTIPAVEVANTLADPAVLDASSSEVVGDRESGGDAFVLNENASKEGKDPLATPPRDTNSSSVSASGTQPMNSSPSKRASTTSTPNRSPYDKNSLSAQHYRSRSVEEIIFIG